MQCPSAAEETSELCFRCELQPLICRITPIKMCWLSVSSRRPRGKQLPCGEKSLFNCCLGDTHNYINHHSPWLTLFLFISFHLVLLAWNMCLNAGEMFGWMISSFSASLTDLHALNIENTPVLCHLCSLCQYWVISHTPAGVPDLHISVLLLSNTTGVHNVGIFPRDFVLEAACLVTWSTALD